MAEPHIELLDPDSAILDTIVHWHWHEWSDGHADADIDQWRARVAARTNRDRVPFTLVAYMGTEPVGCLSVCDDDLDSRFKDQGPWLSGMYVIGRARNRGVGRALVRAAEQRAHTLGARELWLFTGEAGAFYERCGWSYMHRKAGLDDHDVMRRDLRTNT